jgi:hypothetical protein
MTIPDRSSLRDYVALVTELAERRCHVVVT